MASKIAQVDKLKVRSPQYQRFCQRAGSSASRVNVVPPDAKQMQHLNHDLRSFYVRDIAHSDLLAHWSLANQF
jgi:hypothetical protein